MEPWARRRNSVGIATATLDSLIGSYRHLWMHRACGCAALEDCLDRGIGLENSMLRHKGSHLRRRPALVGWLGTAVGALFSVFLLSSSAFAAELADGQKAFLSGEYDEAIRLAREGLRDRPIDDQWAILLTKSLLEVGKYDEARSSVSSSLPSMGWSFPIQLLAYQVMRETGQPEQARVILDRLNARLSTISFAALSAVDSVAIGRALLILEAEPRLVLENFFNEAKRKDPKYAEAYAAIGELALEKGDYDLAARSFQQGLDLAPNDPNMALGLAQAFVPSDRTKMVENLKAALALNPRHIPSLLMLAEHAIDAEDYAKVEKVLEEVFKVNAARPEAWADKAVLAHLNNDAAKEKEYFDKALEPWKTNPEVPFMIGHKLSLKYRFAEGAAYQRKAVEADATYLPAKLQLAQDLLRLGDEKAGWDLAEEVYKRDGYDVGAYNLVTLRDTLSKFAEKKSDHFILRMGPHEMEVYGERALALLEQAREHLVAKYGAELVKTTVVEIYPEQKDFAIRTFGMPGGEGYLGVCFGSLITANSPAAQGNHRSNWEAVLWHEFCHVVTLTMTKNKMPRWLSEGISVFEETQHNPLWGEPLNPRYREMILEGQLSPIGGLSGAFMAPPSPLHLQFAYYESALAVQFLVNHYGMDSLKAILKDLADGAPINETIEKHTEALAKLEEEFATFAKTTALSLAPGLDWEIPAWLRPEIVSMDSTNAAAAPRGGRRGGRGAALATPVPPATAATNYWWLNWQARNLLSEKKWEEAKTPLKTLLQNYPNQSGSGNSYVLLAAAHKNLGETNEELAVLNQLADQDANAVDAYARLMEFAAAQGEWKVVATNAERFLAVNPLLALPHRFLARSSEELGDTEAAIAAYKVLLTLDPSNPAEAHYRLARLLAAKKDPSAKRQVLKALEEAPQFREAYELLLSLTPEPARTPSPPPAPAPAPVP